MLFIIVLVLVVLTFPPMNVKMVYGFEIFMLSGVPLPGFGVEDLAVCKRSYAGKSIVSPHQWGHTVNPVPRLFRAHPLVFRIHLLRYFFVPRLRALHPLFATAVSRRRPTTRTACPRSLLM